MIEIPIAGLLTVIGIFVFVAIGMWVIYVNTQIQDEIGGELRDINARLNLLENKEK